MSADDLDTVCPDCGNPMSPEHAHYRCALCGYRDTCCDGAPAPGPHPTGASAGRQTA